ncbi:MAG: mechanosensitive ion channel family protein [Planctomycetes bacterium]|nr:mechanosensitive ion channel family protein [Planctomycetota bacterium]MCP4840002.1 mechanosensitive ion channel family protein [Planctomycetota bacterium]
MMLPHLPLFMTLTADPTSEETIKSGVDTNFVSILTMLGIVVGAAIVLHVVLSWLLGRLARLSRGRLRWGGVLAGAARMPVGLAIWLLAATWMLEHGASLWVFFAPGDGTVATDVDHFVDMSLPAGRIIIAVFCMTLFAARTVRRTQHLIEDQARDSGSEMDMTALQALFGIGVVLVWIVGIIVGMQALGMNMSAILTIGGIGSAAFAFASKDVIANFFGGIMVLFNRPFRVGDWVVVKGVEGGIERIGLYATYIRTGDKRLVYVPNSVFVSGVIENTSERTNRRLSETIGVRYDDFDAVEAIIADIGAILEADEAIDHNQSVRVSFGGYGDSAIDIAILAFTTTTSIAEFVKIRERLMLQVGRIVQKHDADFAFPTMTVDVAATPPLGN